MSAESPQPICSKEGYVYVADLKDIPQRQGRVFKVQGKRLALFRIDDRCFAINDVCPHQGASLGKGRLKGFLVSCPWHDQQFDIRTGFGPDGGGYCVVQYDVRVEDKQVFVSLKTRDWLTGQ